MSAKIVYYYYTNPAAISQEYGTSQFIVHGILWKRIVEKGTKNLGTEKKDTWQVHSSKNLSTTDHATYCTMNTAWNSRRVEQLGSAWFTEKLCRCWNNREDSDLKKTKTVWEPTNLRRRFPQDIFNILLHFCKFSVIPF